MSRSHHVTLSQLKGLTKSELIEMEKDDQSLLHQLANKNLVKNQIKKERKQVMQKGKSNR